MHAPSVAYTSDSAVALLGRDPSSLSLYDASLSEWAAADDLPMAP